MKDNRTNILASKAYKFRRPRQARGREKFEHILDAADKLIAEKGTADDLSLYDIAKKADVAAGSVYHFFPSNHAVLVALIERYDRKFEEIVEEPIFEEAVPDWKTVIWLQTERSRHYMNATPGALIMILGSGQTWATRIADAEGDRKIAARMLEAIAFHFNVPASPNPEELLYTAIRILEALWGTSYLQHGRVTDDCAAETHRAMCAYLALYWPSYFEHRETDSQTTKQR